MEATSALLQSGTDWPSTSRWKCRAWIINALYACQVLLAASVVTLVENGCAECAPSGVKVHISIAAVFLYSLALGLRCTLVPNINRYVSPIATCIHGLLCGEMVSQGSFCLSCVASAALAGALLAIEVSRYHRLARAAVTLSVGAAVAIGWLAQPVLSMERAVLLSSVGNNGLIGDKYFHPGKLSVIVLVKGNCNFCREFRTEYDRRLREIHGESISLTYVPLRNSPSVKVRVPMIILGRSKERSYVVEGLPTFSSLNGLVLTLKSRPPTP